MYRIKSDINEENKKEKIRREFSKYSKNNRMTLDTLNSKDSSRCELLSLSLNNSVVRVQKRERERKKKIVRTLSNQDAMQYTCAIVKLGQGGLHGVLDSRSA